MAIVEVCFERDGDLPPIDLLAITANEMRLSGAMGPLAGRTVVTSQHGKCVAGQGVRLKKGWIGRMGDGRLVVGSASRVTTIVHFESTDDEAAALLDAIPASLRDWIAVL